MRRSAGLACGARPFQRHVLPGVPSFLILAPLFVSCPFGFLTFDTSRVSGACLPPPSPPLSPPGLFRAPEPFPWAWMAASPFAAASAGDCPPGAFFLPWEPFSPRARHSFPSWGRTASRNIGSVSKAKKKAAVLCWNGGLFPVGWRTTGTSWDCLRKRGRA